MGPTRFVNCDHPAVRDYARRAIGDARSPVDRAVRLFYAIRDQIRYDPYTFSVSEADYLASTVATRDRAFCVPKAILLTACARAVGIPARLGFADVVNHLQSAKLRALMGTDLFVYHGFSELRLGGRWLKVTPAFNIELCRRFDVAPLEFDGHSDALFHEYESGGRRHMEYVRQRGSYADLPFAEMIAAFFEHYSGLKSRALTERDEAFHGDD